jgi:hypothetical protein
MIANMEQQNMPLAGKSGSTRLEGAPPAPPHYPHTADSEHGPPLSENDHVNDLAKNGQGRPRSVPQPNETRVSKGENRREIFALITTPTLVRWMAWHAGNTFFLVTTRLGMVFAFSHRTLHVTKQGGSSYGKLRREGCCVFLSGIRLYLMDTFHISHLLTHKRPSTNTRVRW